MCMSLPSDQMPQVIHHHFHVSSDCPDAQALIEAKIAVIVGADATDASEAIARQLRSVKPIPLKR